MVSEKNNKIKKEEDSDDEEIPYEYSSDDEFETFDTNINSLEDLINLCIDSKNIIDKYNEENKSKEMDDDMPELEENNPEVISKLIENNLLDEKIKNIIKNQKIGVIKLTEVNNPRKPTKVKKIKKKIHIIN